MFGDSWIFAVFWNFGNSRMLRDFAVDSAPYVIRVSLATCGGPSGRGNRGGIAATLLMWLSPVSPVPKAPDRGLGVLSDCSSKNQLTTYHTHR